MEGDDIVRHDAWSNQYFSTILKLDNNRNEILF